MSCKHEQHPEQNPRFRAGDRLRREKNEDKPDVDALVQQEKNYRVCPMEFFDCPHPKFVFKKMAEAEQHERAQPVRMEYPPNAAQGLPSWAKHITDAHTKNTNECATPPKILSLFHFAIKFV